MARPTARRRINGAAVRAIREAVGISQASLARRAQISDAGLSYIERGINGAKPEVMRRIATELGVPLDAITRDPVVDVAEPEDVPA